MNSSQLSFTAPEILAPGGDPDSVKAAILAGADAVYLGLDRFNARMRAENIGLDELASLASLARDRGVRLYVTLNVLLAEKEVQAAVELAKQAIEAGAAALIVQDLGLIKILKEELGQVEIHGSTQLTTHNSGQVLLLSALGLGQVNFSREMSLDEIRRLARFTRDLAMVPEVFVHGAYCVSFSGQCYYSALSTGHSGNRGTCIQACRREYTSSGTHGKANPEHPKLPLNLKDNNALALAKELIESGVGSLKIEGRRKGMQYVYQTVGAWVLEIGRYFSRPFQDHSAGYDGKVPDPGQVFNRGFHAGFLARQLGADMFADSGDDQSLEPSGMVLSYHADKRILQVEGPGPTLLKGRELSIFGADDYFVGKLLVEEVLSPWEFSVRMLGEFKSHLKRGQTIFVHPEPNRQLEEAVRTLAPRPKLVDMTISGTVGDVLTGIFSLRGTEYQIQWKSSIVLEEAASRPIDHETLVKQLGKLGGTGYELGTLWSEGFIGRIFMPLADLNAFRREAIAALDALVQEAEVKSSVAPAPRPKTALNLPVISPLPDEISSARLVVICDHAAEAERYLDLGLVDLAFVDIALRTDALEPGGIMGVLGTSSYVGKRLLPWTQAILFEDDLVALAAQCASPAIGVPACENSGLGFERATRGLPWIAGTHLNVTNSEAALTLGRFGAAAIVASLELGKEQLASMARGLRRTNNNHRPKLWYRAFGTQLAMNTRQCLVRNVAGCPKEVVDDTCLRSCAASGQIRGKGGEIQHVLKRPGYYNQLWLNTLHFNADSLSLKDEIDCFVVDLRDPGFVKMPSAVGDSVLAWFRAGLGQASKVAVPNLDDLKASLPVWNRGLWDKGLV